MQPRHKSYVHMVYSLSKQWTEMRLSRPLLNIVSYVILYNCDTSFTVRWLEPGTCSQYSKRVIHNACGWGIDSHRVLLPPHLQLASHRNPDQLGRMYIAWQHIPLQSKENSTYWAHRLGGCRDVAQLLLSIVVPNFSKIQTWRQWQVDRQDGSWRRYEVVSSTLAMHSDLSTVLFSATI